MINLICGGVMQLKMTVLPLYLSQCLWVVLPDIGNIDMLAPTLR
jgi:hypothetical protein